MWSSLASRHPKPPAAPSWCNMLPPWCWWRLKARLARYFTESLRCSAYHGQVRLGGWSFMVHLQRQVRVHSFLKEIWEICIGIHCWVYDASRGNCAQSSQCLHMLTIKGLKGMQQSQVLWYCSSNLHVNVSTRGLSSAKLHTQLQPTQAKTEYSNDQPPHSVLWAWQHPADDEEDLSFAINSINILASLNFNKDQRLAAFVKDNSPGVSRHKPRALGDTNCLQRSAPDNAMPFCYSPKKPKVSTISATSKP